MLWFAVLFDLNLFDYDVDLCDSFGLVRYLISFVGNV
jgi:hypothetical protein